MNKFITSFHGLRGIASLMVLIAHITGGFHLHTGQLYSNATQELITNLGTFGVEIFFMLSGFVIFNASRNTNLKDFFKRRFWRIYPLFIALTLLYFIANSLLHLEPQKNNALFFYPTCFSSTYSWAPLPSPPMHGP
ncbi:MAG: acyltransferase [Planctomycetes bacterium]|nr:acyltransferase [Planctomycetota bacterium]